jgi:hypothetical protein
MSSALTGRWVAQALLKEAASKPVVLAALAVAPPRSGFPSCFAITLEQSVHITVTGGMLMLLIDL